MGLTVSTMGSLRLPRSGVVRFTTGFYKWYFTKIILAGMYIRVIQKWEPGLASSEEIWPGIGYGSGNSEEKVIPFRV